MTFHTSSPTTKVLDEIQKAPHYNQGDIEFIDAAKSFLSPEEYVGALRFTAMKYGWRLRAKNSSLKDAKKMQWYVEKLVEFLEKDAQA